MADLRGKLVRVYPERFDVTPEDLEGWAEMTDQGKDLSRGLVLARLVEHAREHGIESGTVCKVVMASQFGDFGLTKYLRADHGYSVRMYSECLEEVSEEERPRLLHEYDMGRLNPESRPRDGLLLPSHPPAVVMGKKKT